MTITMLFSVVSNYYYHYIGHRHELAVVIDRQTFLGIKDINKDTKQRGGRCPQIIPLAYNVWSATIMMVHLKNAWLYILFITITRYCVLFNKESK